MQFCNFREYESHFLHILSVLDGDGRLAEEPDHVPDEGQHVALVLGLRLDPATNLLLNTLNETEVRWINI